MGNKPKKAQNTRPQRGEMKRFAEVDFVLSLVLNFEHQPSQKFQSSFFWKENTLPLTKHSYN